MRKGISFTLTLVIVGMVLLVAGFTVIMVGQGAFSQFSNIFTSSSEESRMDLIRQDCLSEKTRLCSQQDFDEPTGWAEQAFVEEKTCMEWAEQENIFGAEGRVPECSS